MATVDVSQQQESSKTSPIPGPDVYWFPQSFDLENFRNTKDEKVQAQILERVSASLSEGKFANGPEADDIYLIAHPGPVLMGTVRGSADGLTNFVPADATVNWVSLGIDHRLSDIWANWHNGNALTPTQVQGIVDTCNHAGADGMAGYLDFAGDDTEIDGVTEVYHRYGGGHESAVVTLRTARARAVAQQRDMVNTQDVILGLLSPGHRDGISLALRSLAAPDALHALDSAVWSTTLTPGPGRNADLDIPDILRAAGTLGIGGVRNATLLHVLLRHDLDKEGTFARLFPMFDSAEQLALGVLSKGKAMVSGGHKGGKTQFDYLITAMETKSLKEASDFAGLIPLSDLFPADEAIPAPLPETLLVPATRVDVPDGEDKLGIEEEAAAFARLIAYKKTKLPLSIGIFGHWGSGKTFFLNTVKRKIDEMQGDDYHQRIVTVEFNAWHYMETNIWASLVSVIFQGLLGAQTGETEKKSTVKLLDALAAVQDSQIDAIEALVNRYRAADTAQDEYVKAVEDVKDHGPQSSDLAITIFRQIKAQRSNDIKTLETALADEEKYRTVGAKKSRRAQLAGVERDKNIFEFLDATEALIASGRLLKTKSRKTLSSPRLLLPLAAALIAAPVGFSYLAEILGWHAFLRSDFAPVVATLTGGAGAAAVWIRRVNAAVTTAFEQVKAAVKENQNTKQYKALRTAELLKVEAARQRLKERSEKADEVREMLMAETFLGRLTQLIQARAEGDTYTRHLGIIATIRADFENLSTLLSKTKERAEEKEVWEVVRDNALDRLNALEKSSDDLIGKYLSDAERAERLNNEAIARDRALLEARHEPEGRARDEMVLIHYGKLTKDLIDETRDKIKDYTPTNSIDRVVLMIDDLDRCPPEKVYDVLQAVHLFLSFPLFVAMVGVDTRWMETSLRKQLGDLVSGKNGATPRDYLEKIFQIPYWAKSLQPDQAQNFVRNLLSDIDARLVTEQPDPGAPDGADAMPQPDAPAAGVSVEHDLDGPPLPPPPVVGPKPPPVSNFAGPTRDEADFVTKVSGYAGTTPRRVIRFLNIFLLIKTLPYGQVDIAKQRAIITQLALCVGTPEIAGAYFDELATAPPNQQVEQFSSNLRQRIEDDGAAEDVRDRIRLLFQTYGEASEDTAMQDLRATADVARKFTFASPEAIELETTGDGAQPPAPIGLEPVPG